MSGCKICGSYAINDRSHGRAKGVDLDMCDVCYWRERAAQADADRERTYQENKILTRLWCELRDKVKSLPKADMTIGAWHDLQDFIKSQAHGGGE